MGASSPIGYGARPIQAAMAGRLRNFQAADMSGWNGEAIRISRLPDLPEAVPRAARIAALVEQAAADLCANLKTLDLPRGVPVFMGFADDSPDSELDTVGSALEQGSQGLLDPQAATLFTGYRGGRIAFLSALAKAIRWFDERGGELALIVAADTRCTREAMFPLFRERRLLTSEDDGTIPGEAAVVALVTPPNTQVAAQHARFMVGRPAFGADDFAALRQAPQAANGLGRALRTLREDVVAGAIRPATVVGFETGELFFTRAFATGYLRNAELMPEPLQHELIAATLGDTGAAAAGMAVLRTDWLLRHLSGATNPRVLIYGHADNGRCAATVTMGRAGADAR
jgi:3-oxoacyl-[acyl-carrier-protein] synthase-1